MKGLVFALLWICMQLLACDKEPSNQELRIEDRIFDYANLLTSNQEDSLFQLIKSLDTEIGSQIAVVIVDTLNGQRIEQYSLQMCERLGLGRSKFNDGILISVAVKNRQMRIEVGTGLEMIIKDEIASRINREEMMPRFREDDFAGGLTSAIKRIIQLIEANKELVGKRPG